MKFDRQTLLIVTFCVLGYVAFEIYLNKKYPNRFKRPSSKESVATELAKPSARLSGAEEHFESSSKPSLQVEAEPGPQLSPSELTIETDTSRYVFSQRTGGFSEIRLGSYAKSLGGEAVNLTSDGPFIVQMGNTRNDKFQTGGFVAKRSAKDRILFQRETDKWRFEHEYRIGPSDYGGTIYFRWTNISDSAQALQSSVLVSHSLRPKVVGTGFLPGIPAGRPAIVSAFDSRVERTDLVELCKDFGNNVVIHKGQSHNVDFFGIDHHYFLGVLIPNGVKTSFEFLKFSGGENADCDFKMVAFNDQGRIKAGETVQAEYDFWFGPKQTSLLEAYNPKLGEAVDFGWFGFIARPLLAALRLLNSWVHNWGLAIILLTILLKLLLYPLTRQAAISMHNTKKFQPRMNELREKYKDDPQRGQRELLSFMRQHKINPMKGCVPILPQLPVFFAFYRVLSASIELRHAPFFGWIHDLSSADPYYVTPVVLGAMMLIQQKLTPTSGLDKNQERIMMMLPLIFGVFMLTLPAGLVIYMLTNTVVSIAQQRWLNKRLGSR